MSRNRLYWILFVLTLTGAALALGNRHYEPENSFSWALGMASLPVIWGVVALMERRRPLASFGDGERRFFTRAIIAAGLLIVVAQGMDLVTQYRAIDADTLRRFWGVATGLVLVVIGNAMPRALSPLAAQCCSDSKVSAVRRFAGWCFVIAGLAYAIAWLALPVAQADRVAMIAVISCMVLVIGRLAWAFTVSRGASSPSPPR